MTTTTASRIKCGNRAAHPVHNRYTGAGYHASTDEVRECFAQTVTTTPAETKPNWRLFSKIPVGGRGYGYYALRSDSDHVTFYRVERRKHGKWAGRTFVKVQAGDRFVQLDKPRAAFSVLCQIHGDPQAAGRLYAAELGRCSRCGATLTDDESRARGMGPECAKKGW